MNRRTFNQWIEAFGEQPPEHEEPRVPVSGRIRRKAELPAIKVPEPYRDDPRMQDRPAQSIDYEATHEYIDPEMEGVTIMVTKEHCRLISNTLSTMEKLVQLVAHLLNISRKHFEQSHRPEWTRGLWTRLVINRYPSSTYAFPKIFPNWGCKGLPICYNPAKCQLVALKQGGFRQETNARKPPVGTPIGTMDQ